MALNAFFSIDCFFFTLTASELAKEVVHLKAKTNADLPRDAVSATIKVMSLI